MCGGTPLRRIAWSVIVGLSPRVRGNRAQTARIPPPPGSIPACAGEPCCEIPARRGPAVYPRVCGGTKMPSYILLDDTGLSPRVRGNLCPDSRRPG